MLKKCWDENVREHMGNVQEKVSAREKSRDVRGEKKWNLEDEDDIMCRNRFDIQIEIYGG